MMKELFFIFLPSPVSIPFLIWRGRLYSDGCPRISQMMATKFIADISPTIRLQAPMGIIIFAVFDRRFWVLIPHPQTRYQQLLLL